MNVKSQYVVDTFSFATGHHPLEWATKDPSVCVCVCVCVCVRVYTPDVQSNCPTETKQLDDDLRTIRDQNLEESWKHV